MKDSTLLWLGIGAVAVLTFAGGEALTNFGMLTATQIKTVAANAGFSGPDLITAVAVALAESGGNPDAHGDTTLGSGTGSFGLWQIYSDAHPQYGPDFTVLYDPQTNANAAYSIYAAAGYRFTPWTTYNAGTYQSFVSQAQTA